MTTYQYIRFPNPAEAMISGNVTVVQANPALLNADVTVTNFPSSTPVTGNVNSYPVGLTREGLVTVVTINNTGWTALPASALSMRNAISIQNQSGQEVKINYSSSIVGYVGMVIPNGGERFYNITQNIVIYGMSSASTCTLNIEELS
jgi:hypothetical protein